MKKHQTIAIVSIIVLAIIVAGVIFVSKKSTEAPDQDSPVSQSLDTSSYKEEDPAPKPVAEDSKTKTYTMTEVATHNSRTSCYTTISGSVYDVTPWISQHPGGQFAILGLCGKDGTESFKNQHGGQARPESELASFKIGTLVQ